MTTTDINDSNTMAFLQSHRNQSDQELLRRLVAIDNGRLVVLGGEELFNAVSSRVNARRANGGNGVPSPQVFPTEQYRDNIIKELCSRLERGLRFGHDAERTNWLLDRLVYYL